MIVSPVLEQGRPYTTFSGWLVAAREPAFCVCLKGLKKLWDFPHKANRFQFIAYKKDQPGTSALQVSGIRQQVYIDIDFTVTLDHEAWVFLRRKLGTDEWYVKLRYWTESEGAE